MGLSRTWRGCVGYGRLKQVRLTVMQVGTWHHASGGMASCMGEGLIGHASGDVCEGESMLHDVHAWA